jgi:hypothetical protein
MSRWLIAIALAAGCLQAATLERLSLDDMIAKSTLIVRGQVQSSRPVVRGSIIYTTFTVKVLEHLKGINSPAVEVVVPGGTYGRLSQTFSGAPRLAQGSEFVFFLWSGRSGLNQVIGLSQGLFTINGQAKGEAIISRAASSEYMVDASGLPVQDGPVRMTLSELRERVRKAGK